MCRFMMVKSTVPIQPGKLLSQFAGMCEKSKAYDGDWQGDGWGISTVSNGNSPAHWKTHKSVLPVWEDTPVFTELLPGKLFIVHARSASFPQHKNVITYNQPFTDEPFAFVFNGLVKGVSLPYAVPGDIGSQKIWSILVKMLQSNPPEKALLILRKMLDRHARSIQALNIGLCNQDTLFAYCHYTQHPDYYRLYYHKSDTLSIIVSEPLEDYECVPVQPEQVLVC